MNCISQRSYFYTLVSTLLVRPVHFCNFVMCCSVLLANTFSSLLSSSSSSSAWMYGAPKKVGCGAVSKARFPDAHGPESSRAWRSQGNRCVMDGKRREQTFFFFFFFFAAAAAAICAIRAHHALRGAHGWQPCHSHGAAVDGALLPYRLHPTHGAPWADPCGPRTPKERPLHRRRFRCARRCSVPVRELGLPRGQRGRWTATASCAGNFLSALFDRKLASFEGQHYKNTVLCEAAFGRPVVETLYFTALSLR